MSAQAVLDDGNAAMAIGRHAQDPRHQCLAGFAHGRMVALLQMPNKETVSHLGLNNNNLQVSHLDSTAGGEVWNFKFDVDTYASRAPKNPSIYTNP
jgi:hypothetical protein